MSRYFPALLVAFVTMLDPASALATGFVIVNLDTTGEGLNDPTAAIPVGGNTGTTRGAQALQVFERAGSIWAAHLESPVEIVVDTHFQALACSASAGTLGSAGPTTVHVNFTGAPQAGTWYAQALGNALFGADLSPSTSDIAMRFNGALGSPGCLESVSWYMGFDESVPSGGISLLSVALHEIAHGLGFTSLVNSATGAKLSGLNDAYMNLLEDHSTGTLYPAMTDNQRVAASLNTGNLHWTGAAVLAAAPVLSAGVSHGHVEMYAPSILESGSSVSHFSTSLTPDELMEPSYNGPNLEPGLALQLLVDMGWESALCGNGSLNPGEECDDGNQVEDDGCDARCLLPPAINCASAARDDCAEAGAGGFTFTEKKPGAEVLKAQWKKLAGSTSLSGFGDPVGGSTEVSVCLYDDASNLIQDFIVDRAGQDCALDIPCWALKGGGYAYKDRLLSEDGIGVVTFVPGATGVGRALVSGKNVSSKGLNSLPSGVVAQLDGQTAPTVQLVTDNNFCASVTMNLVKKSDGIVYQAVRE